MTRDDVLNSGPCCEPTPRADGGEHRPLRAGLQAAVRRRGRRGSPHRRTRAKSPAAPTASSWRPRTSRTATATPAAACTAGRRSAPSAAWPGAERSVSPALTAEGPGGEPNYIVLTYDLSTFIGGCTHKAFSG